MLKRLRLKFVCINMTIITIMLLIILTVVAQFTRMNMEQRTLQMMQNIASNPLYLMKPTENLGAKLPYFTLRLDSNGTLLEARGNYYDLSDTDFLNEIIQKANTTTAQTGLLKDYNLRYMHVFMPADHFLIFVDITNELSTMDNLTRNCTFIGILSFFAFLGISIFLARWAVKPIEQAWTQQKQFIGDASHELKTPLTVIMTNAELLQSPEYDSEKKSKFSDNILVMTKQMRNLVERLLELSRIDNGSMETVMEPLNFSTLVETSLCPFDPLYYEAGLELISDITPGVMIKGSEEHLKQVMDILLENALKYATPNTAVKVHLQKQRFSCLLSVSNQGDPISEEDLTNIFKRFYRADPSRTQTKGYGLGLSIAENIITKHHGRIRAESDDGNNTFYIRLPILQ